MDTIKIICLAVLFVGAILATVHFLPAWIVKWRAANAGTLFEF